MNGHLDVETQNPQEIKNIALRSLEEYRTELEEEQYEETRRKDTKGKGKEKKVTSTKLLMHGTSRTCSSLFLIMIETLARRELTVLFFSCKRSRALQILQFL